MKTAVAFMLVLFAVTSSLHAQDWWKPYSDPCVEREDVFAFSKKPSVKLVAKDKYEISFATRGFCDVTVGLIDPSTGSGQAGGIVRHLASGVLGKNAPEPFQKNSLEQKIHWNGKDDFGIYVKEPEKLKVRVSLGLKPTFDKRLGGTSGKNIPGTIWGMTADADGVYVFSDGTYGRIYVRHFDFTGRYVKSLVPPPANLPEEKLTGMSYVEYEPGKKALHSPSGYGTVAYFGTYLPRVGGLAGGGSK